MCNICICNRKKPALSLIAQSGPYQVTGLSDQKGSPSCLIQRSPSFCLWVMLTGFRPCRWMPSYRDGEKRNAIIAAMSKPTKDGFWELQRDYVLASPSTAASYCSGRSCNGWLHWINNAGQSLDELYRGE